MTVSPADSTLMPAPLKLPTSRPVILLPLEPLPRVRPSNDCPCPLICTPASVVPSIVVGTVMAGRALFTLMTNGAVPGIANVIV